MWKLLSLPNLYWHYKPILRLAGVVGFLQMTLLMNNFAHPWYMDSKPKTLSWLSLIHFSFFTSLPLPLLSTHAIIPIHSHVALSAWTDEVMHVFGWAAEHPDANKYFAVTCLDGYCSRFAKRLKHEKPILNSNCTRQPYFTGWMRRQHTAHCYLVYCKARLFSTQTVSARV